MGSPYTKWINAKLEPLGEGVKHIEPVSTGQVSAVFAVLTNRHRYYLKTCSVPFTHEPLLAAALDSWMPGSVPPVLAVDTARHWLLMADAGHCDARDLGIPLEHLWEVGRLCRHGCLDASGCLEPV